MNTSRFNPAETVQVVDLPTPEGWKAELTRVLSVAVAVIGPMVYLRVAELLHASTGIYM